MEKNKITSFVENNKGELMLAVVGGYVFYYHPANKNHTERMLAVCFGFALGFGIGALISRMPSVMEKIKRE